MTRPASYVVQVRKVTGGELAATALTYCYSSPLHIGDQVLCPANEFTGPFIAQVVQLGSNYDGHIRSLICRVAPDRKRA